MLSTATAIVRGATAATTSATASWSGVDTGQSPFRLRQIPMCIILLYYLTQEGIGEIQAKFRVSEFPVCSGHPPWRGNFPSSRYLSRNPWAPEGPHEAESVCAFLPESRAELKGLEFGRNGRTLQHQSQN